MTVKQLKTWLCVHEVPDTAVIIVSHPGGHDAFRIDEYDKDANVLVIQGTG